MNQSLNIYLKGVLWFMLSLLISSINDVITKYLGNRLGSYEITFFRFLFGTFTLMPFIMYKGSSCLKTSRPMIHFFRGLILFLGISGWTYGLSIVQVTTATIITFTIPIFVLILGVFFLQEQVIWQRWVVTILVFAGLIVTINPTSSGFNPQSLVLIFSAILFATLDIINKKFVIEETMISMLFYSAIITALFALPFAAYYWQTPNSQELLLLFTLGAGANLILFCLLKAFALIDATALAPYRYINYFCIHCLYNI